MLDNEEILWIQSTASELNNLWQIITDSYHLLENASAPDGETEKYFNMLRNSIERAAETTRGMLKRAGELDPGGLAGNIPDARQDKPSVAIDAEPVKQPAPRKNELQDAGFSNVKIANPDGSKEMILIVDDEELVAQMAQRVLADDGYCVITARDGFECLDIYKRLKEKIALVILDFTMPVMDGAEVFDELYLIDSSVCVVLSSGFTEQGKLRNLLAKGLRGFIPKPYTPHKLLLQVNATLSAIKSQK